MRTAPLALAALLLAAPAAAFAQTPAPGPAQVTVTLGDDLAKLAPRYGADELDGLRKELAHDVAAAAAKGGFTRVELVLQDATPNRPTPAMRSQIDAVDLRSTSLGGAAITGTAYGPNGPQPLKSSWYETSFSSEIAGGPWFDASRAFTYLADDLKHGRVPQKFGPNTPPHISDVRNPLDPWNFPRR